MLRLLTKTITAFILSVFMLSSCSNKNKISEIVDVINTHPEAHSILFYDPSTSFINEGDKTATPLKLDYITFSNGFFKVKFVGEDEIKYNVKEPKYATWGSLDYTPEGNSNYSFSIRLDAVVVFEKRDGKFYAAHVTKSSEDRMMEYLNILLNKGNKSTPPMVNLLMKLTKHTEPLYELD